MTLPERCRRVSVLPLLLAALSLGAQEADAPPPQEGSLGIPDIVITGPNAVIIVPPLPILPGGGIPVPPIELAPLPWLLSPDPLPESIELSGLPAWVPFTVAELGIDLPAPDGEGTGDQESGGKRDDGGAS